MLFPIFVIVPPCSVPGFIFTYSLNLLLSPIISEFNSPLNFKSWGGVPIDENGKIFESGKRNFLKRIDTVNFSSYHLNDPFKQSGEALYYWSPIADELKSLDKKIVLNSIHLKWGLMKDEFKKLTKNLKFD